MAQHLLHVASLYMIVLYVISSSTSSGYPLHGRGAKQGKLFYFGFPISYRCNECWKRFFTFIKNSFLLQFMLALLELTIARKSNELTFIHKLFCTYLFLDFIEVRAFCKAITVGQFEYFYILLVI